MSAASDGPIITSIQPAKIRQHYRGRNIHPSLLITTIRLIMPKTWSKPYREILKAGISKWHEADDKVLRFGHVEKVANQILDVILKDGDDEIPDLQDVSVDWTLCRCALVTLV